jgi:hypothetical protein
VLDVIDIARAEAIVGRELDYAFRSHFDLVLINSATLLPIAAVELDGQQHESDPLTQARDRLKDSLCHKAGMPLVRVRWGAWQALESLVPLLPPAE